MKIIKKPNSTAYGAYASWIEYAEYLEKLVKEYVHPRHWKQGR